MENDILNIAVSGDEKNKNEIVYNNVVDAMERLNMTKDEQVEYLKTKITTLETDYQNNMMILFTIFLSLAVMSVGIYLLITNDYILGISFVLIGFALTVYKLIKALIRDRKIRNKKFMELEGIRSSLNSILK